VALVVDQGRPEASLEHVTTPVDHGVEPRCEQPLQLAHPVREIDSGTGDDEVHMVRHEADGVDRPPVFRRDVPKEEQVPEVVAVVEEDPPPVDAPRTDMVRPIGKQASRAPWHGDRR
jgi:hypothetical protein